MVLQGFKAGPLRKDGCLGCSLWFDISSLSSSKSLCPLALPALSVFSRSFRFFFRGASFPRAALTAYVVVNCSKGLNFFSALIWHFRLLQRQWGKWNDKLLFVLTVCCTTRGCTSLSVWLLSLLLENANLFDSYNANQNCVVMRHRRFTHVSWEYGAFLLHMTWAGIILYNVLQRQLICISVSQ